MTKAGHGDPREPRHSSSLSTSHRPLADRIVLVDPVFKALRKQRRLPAIDPLNKAPHPTPPQIASESYSANQITKCVFTQPGSTCEELTQGTNFRVAPNNRPSAPSRKEGEGPCAAKPLRGDSDQTVFDFLEIVADVGSRSRTEDPETLSFRIPRRLEISDEPTNPARPKE